MGPFHLFSLPFLSMNPYAQGLLPRDIQPNEPRFDFLTIKANLGPSYSHRPTGSKNNTPYELCGRGGTPQHTLPAKSNGF